MIYGYERSQNLNINRTGIETYHAIMIGFQPIEKPLEPVSREEIADLMDKMEKHINLIGLEMTPIYNEIRERIKKAGVKNEQTT